MSLGGNDQLNQERLVINDVLYGSISFSSLIKSIVDSEQFQRLRDIKQLGVTHLVFPSAMHSRFEHSIGTAYLCAKFLKILKEQLTQSRYGIDLSNKFSEEIITDKDIMCVQLAGLLHDLGHGPFSHLFDKIDNTGCWTHEQMSCKMIDYLIETNPHVQVQMRLADFNHNDINLIKDLILGVTPHRYNNSTIPYNESNINNSLSKHLSSQPQSTIISFVENGLSSQPHSTMVDNDDNIPCITLRDDRNIRVKKWFLYQIVSNKFNGIDCDKFDYILRDCYYVGVKCNYDYMRYFQNCQLLQTTIDGIYISPRDKELLNINELFYSRWGLHRKVYRHKTVIAIELMLHEALKLSDEYFQFGLSLQSPQLFSKLTDNIYYHILYSTEPLLEKSRHILTCITKRKILKLCGQVTLSDTFPFSTKSSSMNYEKKILAEILRYDSSNLLNPNLVHIDIMNISSGMNISNPINNIIFHTKNGEFAKLRPQYVSNMIPKVFSDRVLRVFVGSLNDGYDPSIMEEDHRRTVACFQDWCVFNKFPLPHTISMKDTSGYFTHIPSDKMPEFYKRISNSIDYNQYTVPETDKKVTKILKFNDSSTD